MRSIKDVISLSQRILMRLVFPFLQSYLVHTLRLVICVDGRLSESERFDECEGSIAITPEARQ